MGYFYRNGSIECFEPDDTDSVMWVHCADFAFTEHTLADIITRCQEKWGAGVDFAKCRMTAAYVHVDCLGYDRYDPGDYTNYLKIELLP